MNFAPRRLWYLMPLFLCLTVVGCDKSKDGGSSNVKSTETKGSAKTKTEADTKTSSSKTDDSGKKPDDSGKVEPAPFVYSGHSPVWLDQNWTRDESKDFYFQDQGSELVPYEWFMAVEQVDNKELFRSDKNMIALGYITQPKDPNRNKHGLPIGFVEDDKPASTDLKIAAYGAEYQKENYPKTSKWLGLTCAACHTADITYKGTVIRIDGGPAMADHESFLSGLTAALRATANSDEKFARFEKGVRAFRKLDTGGGESDDLTTLRAELKSFTGHMEQLVQMNAGGEGHEYGFARLDAFGAILNEVTVGGLGIKANARPSDAPVSFPYVWYASHLDYVQWNRSADNALARNVGEVLGVYAHFQLTGPPATMFRSTANFNGLIHLEDLLEKLKAPVWPEEILGKLDAGKVELGSKLFAQNCESCHAVRDEDGKFPMTEPFGKEKSQFIITSKSTLKESGTDPKMIMNFAVRKADPGSMRKFLNPAVPEGDVSAARILVAAVSNVLARFAVEDAGQPANDPQKIGEFLNELGGNHPPKAADFVPDGYISRPLYGIWATAPFLHNGSVPNLYELLQTDTKRSPSFYVGSREFDPVRVGFVTTKSAERSFEFKTVDADGKPIMGNLNVGHSGPEKTQTLDDDGKWRDFTEEERWALIEYMKTLK